MTESDYILAARLTRLRVAATIVRDTLVHLEDDQRHRVQQALFGIEEQISDDEHALAERMAQ